MVVNNNMLALVQQIRLWSTKGALPERRKHKQRNQHASLIIHKSNLTDLCETNAQQSFLVSNMACAYRAAVASAVHCVTS